MLKKLNTEILLIINMTNEVVLNGFPSKHFLGRGSCHHQKKRKNKGFYLLSAFLHIDLIFAFKKRKRDYTTNAHFISKQCIQYFISIQY